MIDDLIEQFKKEDANSGRFQLTMYHEHCQEIGIPAIQMEETQVAQFLKSFNMKEIKETYLNAIKKFYKWCKMGRIFI